MDPNKVGDQQTMTNSTQEVYRPGSLPEIFQLVEMVARRLKQIHRDTLRDTDLTPPQYFVLSLLWQRDGRPFKELASATFCSPATMTGIVDTLEKKELVMREPNPDDRRSLLVRLTPSGERLRESTPSLDRVFRGCCDGLPPNEAEQLSSLLHKLHDALQAGVRTHAHRHHGFTGRSQQ
jgi:DNA-binding MarR family transcriptional regulator